MVSRRTLEPGNPEITTELSRNDRVHEMRAEPGDSRRTTLGTKLSTVFKKLSPLVRSRPIQACFSSLAGLYYILAFPLIRFLDRARHHPRDMRLGPVRMWRSVWV